jgi:hypothetical protein
MARLREVVRQGLSAALVVTLTATPIWSAAPSAPLATVVSSEHARVGTSAASVGTTVFNGDRLETEQNGRVQVRAGAARLQLSSSSRVTWGTETETPSATLTAGTATFSTANSKAFALHMGSAVIRPSGDAPAIGNVTFLNPKEFLVRCSRGAVSVTVDDDSRVVTEGTAYHVMLDPGPARLAEAAAEPRAPGGIPKAAGGSKFIWFAIGIAAVATYFIVSEALESPDRP